MQRGVCFVRRGKWVIRAISRRARSWSRWCTSRNALGTRLRNVVLMAMGEPLHTYDAVMHAIDILLDLNGPSLAAERITLSTVEVVPGSLRLAAERRPIHLAVSRHASTQAERAALVPAARKWSLDELMVACRTYSELTGRYQLAHTAPHLLRVDAHRWEDRQRGTPARGRRTAARTSRVCRSHSTQSHHRLRRCSHAQRRRQPPSGYSATGVRVA